MTADHPLVARAKELAAEIAPRGAEIEAARRIPADIRAAMAQAGFFRMFIGQAQGGPEIPPGVAARVFEALAQGDAACGWVAFIGATTGLALSRITNGAAAEMLAKPDALLTGVFAPLGAATKVDGGFRVSGRWQWGSGSPNADWIGGGCILMEDGQPLTNSAGVPRNHMLFFPAAEVELLDTWHVSGLCGTGSGDFQVTDLFVPETRASGYLVRTPPDRPLFRFPPFSPLAQGVGAVALGVARASIDELVRLAGEKKRAGSTLAARGHVQIEVARAEARLRSARAFFYDSIDAAWDVAQAGGPVPVSFARDMRLAVTHAASESAKVVDSMYTLAGGASVYRASPLQRHLRDIHAATQHAMVGFGTLETAGRLFLGQEVNLTGF